MRQVMPHRNNMCLHRSKRKIFLRCVVGFPESAALLQQPRFSLPCEEANISSRNNELRFGERRLERDLQRMGMADMRILRPAPTAVGRLK
jgi:hypothetical protein